MVTKFEECSFARSRSNSFSNFPYICPGKFGWVEKCLDVVRGKNLQAHVWKLKKKLSNF